MHGSIALNVEPSILQMAYMAALYAVSNAVVDITGMPLPIVVVAYRNVTLGVQ